MVVKIVYGVENGLVKQTNKACENTGYLKSVVIHYIIHQQVLCGEYLHLSCVTEPQYQW